LVVSTLTSDILMDIHQKNYYLIVMIITNRILIYSV
jgi:hypothetical protein